MIWKSFNSYAACAQKLIFIISIHAPRERCELYRPIFTIVVNGFQSTHRVSDANLNGRHECFRSYDFNPRTAWAMRTQSLWDRHYQQKISIHAPRERCEPQIRNSMTFTCFLFQFYDKQSWIHLQYFLQFSHLSGANLPGFSCSLLVRTRISSIFIENIHY